MLTINELKALFGEGPDTEYSEETVVVPATDTAPESTEIVRTSTTPTPYLFYGKATAPVDPIKWASDNVAANHWVTELNGSLYVAVTSPISVVGLSQITG